MKDENEKEAPSVLPPKAFEGSNIIKDRLQMRACIPNVMLLDKIVVCTDVIKPEVDDDIITNIDVYEPVN